MSTRAALNHIAKVVLQQKVAPVAFDQPHFLFDSPLDIEVADGGIEVSEVSAAEYLEAKNGPLKLDVPHVSGEHKVEMRGTVPAEWSLL
ncbi:hypothetical protein SAMN05518669_103396 [Variovorax sp. YR634]|uniref:hypothetical protein n=1 Tax=Variovorax sp. YR634 TaxID=1884385 RepID=UPI000897A089|nr:hypothetical protein [Variovorax sp. YR634]SDX14556.1 hypothetical protein SAMN05518669_103396 [Variovorax sp. YR634]